MPRQPALTPWQELEEQARLAYREWPLFLKMRLRELKRHLPPEAFAADKTVASQPAAASSPEQTDEHLTLLHEYGLMTATDNAHDPPD